MSVIISVAGACSLAGCQTTAEYQAQVNANLDGRLSAYQGSTMAEFIARTGLTPVNAYPVADGSVFVVEGSPVYMTLPATQYTPAITRSTSCQLLIQTEPTGAGGNADGWKIVGTSRSGPCNNLPV